MKSVLKKIHPNFRLLTFFGFVYLLAIIAFAIVYCLPSFEFTTPCGVRGLEFWESIYFSVVTITTLGYGEFTPLNTVARVATSIEAVIGVGILGLLFVSVGYALSNIQLAKEKELLDDQRKLGTHFLYAKLARILSNWMEKYDENRAPIQMSGGSYYFFGKTHSVLARSIHFTDFEIRERIRSSKGIEEDLGKTFSKSLLDVAKMFKKESDRFGYLVDNGEMLSEFDRLINALHTNSDTILRRDLQTDRPEQYLDAVLEDFRIGFITVSRLRDILFSNSTKQVDGSTVRYSPNTDYLDEPKANPTYFARLLKYLGL